MTFLRPWLLLLLPAVLAVVVISFTLVRGRRRDGKRFHAVIRGILVSLVVLALADPFLTRDVEGRAVAFIVDTSLSVPDASVPAVAEWLESARARRRASDDESILLFADGAAVEVPFGARDRAPALDLARPRSRLNREATDLAGAIRMAQATFPEGLDRRIVLITDGNQNRGDAVAEARRAVGSGVDLAILPIAYHRTREASVLRVDTVPTSVPGAVVGIQPVLQSTEEGLAGKLRAFVNGEEIATEDVVLPAGKWRGPTFRVLFPDAGIQEVSVALEVEGDSILENNEARSIVHVVGRAGVLVIEGERSGESEIADVLRSMGIVTIVWSPGRMPDSPLFYQPFDAVVLSDVAALDLTDDQLSSLETAVRDLGVGCVVLSGEDAYAPGGYRDTALERLLPVWMDIRQKQVMLNGALVLILHTCELATGNYWAKEISRASILTLNERDYAGLIIYGNVGVQWLLPLQQVVNPVDLANRITATSGGDMPSFDASLELAANALIDCPAHLKHIIVISDGDAAQPDAELIGRIVKDRITVSTVCIAPHGKEGIVTMKALARWGRGRLHVLNAGQFESLPRIFIKEATTLRRNAIKRELFVPRYTMAPEDLPPALRGFGGALPALAAHSLTEAKDRAEVPLVTPDGDPVLAVWRYGLGETAAFTSALKGGWIGDWNSWDGLDRFFAQVVRSVFRRAGRSGFSATGTAEGGMGTVRLTAISEAGDELDFLTVSAVATRAGEEPRPFPVVQKGGGVYEGSFPLRGTGTWVAVLRYEDPATGAVAQLEVPVAVSYPEEYASLSTDEAFLARLTEEAGARLLTGEEDVFAGDSEGAEASRPLGPLLLLLAALLLPIDVFFRRVRWDPRPLIKRLLPARKEPRRTERASRPITAVVPDAPDDDAPPPKTTREAPVQERRVEPKGKEEEPDSGHIDGLLEAKKRAKKKRRWEET